MNTRISKSAILAACIQKQQDLINNFRQRIEDSKSEAFTRNETPSQTDEGSTSPEELMHVMEQELNFVNDEMNILGSIDPEDEAHRVARGAVVVTDKRIFFIAVSSEEVEVGGERIFGMSDRAPLFSKMRNLQKGDSFQYHDTAYHIEDIY